MLALSTSCISALSTDGYALLNHLEKFDISAIELDYRISDVVLRQILEPLQKSRLKIISVHNYFPIPSEIPGAKGGGDFFRLSSPDKEESRQAVHWTTKTIEYAGKLGAAAVVLHCGHVEMNAKLDKLYSLYNSNRIRSKEAQAFITEMLAKRERSKTIYLESLLLNLEQLFPIAEKHGVLLGIENRYHYHELPTFEDFDTILTRFKGSPLGYWHDTGHAHANECLTIIPPGSLLRAYEHYLIGIHLHDAIGLDDHLVPGAGDIDFQKNRNIIKNNKLQVLELKPGTPASAISQAISFARKELL